MYYKLFLVTIILVLMNLRGFSQPLKESWSSYLIQNELRIELPTKPSTYRMEKKWDLKNVSVRSEGYEIRQSNLFFLTFSVKLRDNSNKGLLNLIENFLNLISLKLRTVPKDPKPLRDNFKNYKKVGSLMKLISKDRQYQASIVCLWKKDIVWLVWMHWAPNHKTSINSSYRIATSAKL